MSIPPQYDTTNPANTNSQHWRQTHDSTVKRSPPTRGDWMLTAAIVGFFAVIILFSLLKQHSG